MKIPSSVKRDFAAYESFHFDDFCPFDKTLVLLGDKSALECFFEQDAHGKKPTSCSEPEKLMRVTTGKQCLGLHIKDIWGPGIKDASLISLFVAWSCVCELIVAMPEIPEWVWKAVWKVGAGGHEFFYLHSFADMMEDYPPECWPFDHYEFSASHGPAARLMKMVSS